jgi:hypothetical protein
MPKMPKIESLQVEDLGALDHYDEDELVRLREKLITNEQRIHQESVHLGKRIKELNQARNDLQQEVAQNARSMRAVKHQLSQRARAGAGGSVVVMKVPPKRAGSLAAVRSGQALRARRK